MFCDKLTPCSSILAPSIKKDQRWYMIFNKKQCQNKKIFISALSIFLVGFLISITLIIILSSVTSDDNDNENENESSECIE